MLLKLRKKKKIAQSNFSPHFLIKKYDLDPKKYEPKMTGNSRHKWIYRGQITQLNNTVLIQAHVKETIDENDNYTIVADGSLLVDGICIYEMEDFSIQFVPMEKTIREETAQESGIQNKERSIQSNPDHWNLWYIAS